MDWTLAPVVALMIFTADHNGNIVDGVWYENKPYATCMRKADSMRAERRDPYKMPACIRTEAAQHFMENKHGARIPNSGNNQPHHHAAQDGRPRAD
jgi:hypothetical protein